MTKDPLGLVYEWVYWFLGLAISLRSDRGVVGNIIIVHKCLVRKGKDKKLCSHLFKINNC